MSGRICLPVLITALACCLQAQAPDESAYRTRVQPFLEKHCLGCHNDKVKVADLRLAGSSLSDPV